MYFVPLNVSKIIYFIYEYVERCVGVSFKLDQNNPLNAMRSVMH